MNNELIAIQKECGRRQKELTHTIDARTREAAAIDNRGWCNLHVPELALHYKSKSDEYWRLFKLWFGAVPDNPTEREIDDQIREARLYKFGQFAFLLVETIAAAVLASIFFNGPQLVSMMVGVAIAFLLGAAASAVVTRWVRHEASGQPTKQMERITRGLLVLGLPWLIACVTALAVLRSQGSVIGAFIFFVSTTAVTLLSPLCSGLCGYAADLLRWSKRLCADMRWIRSLARDLDHLLTTSERSIPPGGPGAGAPPNPVSRVLKAIAAPAAAALVVLALFGAPATAQAADIPVYLFPDVSPSARSGDVIRVLKTFSARLSSYDGESTLVLSLTPFYEDAFMAASTVRVVIPGNRQVSCASAESDSEIVRLSKPYAETARRDAARKCDELRTQARREDSARRTTEIAKLAAAIDQLAGLNLPGRCTAVNAMIRRAVRETPNGVSIVVSDLENSCVAQGLPANLQPENRVFIIPVGSRQHPIEAGFDAIQSRFARTMPWIQVIEPFRLEAIIDAISHPETRVAANH
ncbi:MAG TPA: hypothetical protein VE957_07085 [Terriglobales bacterium]|nr:hypothetical protein [Gemmataceae bacterium]HYW37859.1 hypothetical protein [Terriglobales bacterium]